MSPQHPLCRTIEPDLLSVIAGEAGSAAAGRVEARGTYRVNLRHGVSRLRSGHRHTVGVIFHDAT